MMETTYYPSSAGERAMKVQEVILRAIDGRLKWYQAAAKLMGDPISQELFLNGR